MIRHISQEVCPWNAPKLVQVNDHGITGWTGGRRGIDRTWDLVEHPTDVGVVGPPSGVAVDAQAVEGEGRSSAVAEEPFAAGVVGAVDADGRMEAEAAGALPD